MDGSQPELKSTRAAVLADMQAVVIQLRAVLDAEREALDCLDSLALDAATTAKSDLLQRLESLEAERGQLDDMAAPIEGSSWRNLHTQLEACRDINDINGRIVVQRLRHVRHALGILRGIGEGAPVLYGPGGRAQAAVPHRPLSQA